MLEKYQTKYGDFVNYINQSIIKNKMISHAYLLVVQNNDEIKRLIIDFAKVILCPHELKGCENCNICNLIDNNSYGELVIIEPDGLMVKKEQLRNLQDTFISKSLNNRRVYIIFGADKLNASSGNSILKFLEEPMDNITAILVCENYLNVLKTITSRCLVINIHCNDNEKLDFALEENLKILGFITKLENLREDTLAFINEFLTDASDRQLLDKRLDTMLRIYQQVLDYKSGKLKGHDDHLVKIVNSNDLPTIIKKINVLCDIKKKLKYNVNVNLLMDKLIIDLSSC